MFERMWLERVCFLSNMVKADDCIYVKQMRVAGKTVPRGMYDFMISRLHENYERAWLGEACHCFTAVVEFCVNFSQRHPAMRIQDDLSARSRASAVM